MRERGKRKNKIQDAKKNLVFEKNCEGKRKKETQKSTYFFLNFLEFEKEKGKSNSKRQKKIWSLKKIVREKGKTKF